MPPSEKRSRLARIKHVAHLRGMDPDQEPTEITPADVPPKGQVYWLTRSLIDGQLDGSVTVWVSPPKFVRQNETTTYWVSELEPVGVLSPEACLKEAKTYPDDGRQCIRVGE